MGKEFDRMFSFAPSNDGGEGSGERVKKRPPNDPEISEVIWCRTLGKHDRLSTDNYRQEILNEKQPVRIFSYPHPGFDPRYLLSSRNKFIAHHDYEEQKTTIIYGGDFGYFKFCEVSWIEIKNSK